MRIEVGAGLEKIVTDTEAARIIEIEMLPLFRKGDMAAGIRHGAAAIVADLSETQS